jgi:hypothetical protein
MHAATTNLLGAIRDLVSLREWIGSGETVTVTEIQAAVFRVERTTDIWSSEGCPDAPESIELEGRE